MSEKQIETTVDIAAPVQRVWAELTSFANFSEWSRFILAIRGDLRTGSKLEVRLDQGKGPMTIRPQLVVHNERQELRWRGTLGASFVFWGEHYFQLAPLPDGGTRFTHGERFGGVLLPLLWKSLDTQTRKAFGEFNEALRARSEAAVAA